MPARPAHRRPRIEAKEVKERARGQWIGILEALAGDDLGPAINKLGSHVPCPRHDSPDGFRLFRDAPDTGGGVCSTCGHFSDGFALLQWLHGWSFVETLKAVAREVGLDVDGEIPAPRQVARKVVDLRPKRDPEVLQRSIRRVWDEAVELTHPRAAPVVEYLLKRGLWRRGGLDVRQFGSGEVLAHPSLPYYEDGKLQGHYPAMVARVSAADGTKGDGSPDLPDAGGHQGTCGAREETHGVPVGLRPARGSHSALPSRAGPGGDRGHRDGACRASHHRRAGVGCGVGGFTRGLRAAARGPPPGYLGGPGPVRGG